MHGAKVANEVARSASEYGKFSKKSLEVKKHLNLSFLQITSIFPITLESLISVPLVIRVPQSNGGGLKLCYMAS